MAGSAPPSSTFDLRSLLTDATWSKAMQGEFEETCLEEIEIRLQVDYADGKTIYPPQDKIFRAFNLTPLNKVKVVILGQDPYHDDGQADGLCFSVPDGCTIPPSLKNIFKELTKDIQGFTTPNSGCLVKWATEGVLLLNATLTGEAHKRTHSHQAYGWQKLTDRVIEIISDQCPFVVFILWGNFARKKEKLIDGKKHFIIEDAHPSPLSSRLRSVDNCFSMTNDALRKNGMLPIDWCL